MNNKKNNVLCAIDVTDFDQSIVDLAADFAKQFDVGLDLIHVTPTPDPTNSAFPAYVGAPNELVRDNRLFREITTSVEGVTITRHHVSGLPSEQVVGFVQRNSPQLLVLGTHARKGISRLLGSIAAKIMRRVTCPVLIYRQRQDRQSAGHNSPPLTKRRIDSDNDPQPV